MALKLVFLFYFLFSHSIFAENPLGMSSLTMENGIAKTVFCEELMDGFCELLWSSENQGNFQFSDGIEILYGERRDNIISNAQFIHIQKLAKSRCSLPADIQDMMGIQVWGQ